MGIPGRGKRGLTLRLAPVRTKVGEEERGLLPSDLRERFLEFVPLRIRSKRGHARVGPRQVIYLSEHRASQASPSRNEEPDGNRCQREKPQLTA